MRHTARFRGLVAGLLAVVLAVGPVPAAAAPAGGGMDLPAVGYREVGPARVSAEVSEAFADGAKEVTFLLLLREQADVEAAAAAGRAMAALQAERQGSVAGQPRLRLAARAAVVEALQATAERTQRGLLQEIAALSARGAVSAHRPLWIVNLVSVTGSQAALERLAVHPEVAAVLPNTEIQLDPLHLQDVELADADVEWNIERVGAPQAWALGADGTGVVVGSLDTGVRWDHPALKERFRGYDPANPDVPQPIGNWYDAVSGNPMPYDDHDHGTHVTGTMVGAEPDGSNKIGVAPGARWVAAKVFSAAGGGTPEWILAGAQYLLAPTDADGTPRPEWAPDVINNSWGGGMGMDEWFRPMVQAWRAADIFPAVAAGNFENPGPGSISVPANYPESFAVGATDISDRLAGFSGRGPSPYGEIKPEVTAPGVGVRSSTRAGYGAGTGTSMATPHVAGAVALLKSVDATLDVDSIEELLLGTATPLTDAMYPESPNNGYGWGLLNAFDAVASLTHGLGSLTGRVWQEGIDVEPPVIHHEPVSEAFHGSPVGINAVIEDDVAVVEADLFARFAGQSHYTHIPMLRIDGDHTSGTYVATIPPALVQPAAVQYYIEAIDVGLNRTRHGPHTIDVLGGIEPGYFQDFESQPTGWVSGGSNDPWQWGEPTPPPAPYSGLKVYGTNLSGNYPDDANAYLLMPPIDLTDHPEGAYLTFKHWYDLETNWDFGDIFVSTDMEQWEHKAEFTGVSDGWQTVVINLSDYGGQMLFVAFNLYSDFIINRRGWYLDDVALVSPSDTGPPPPTGLSATAEPLGEVALAWNAHPEAMRYGVYRSMGSEAMRLVGTTALPQYLDATTQPDTAYAYHVTAIDAFGGEGDPSEPVPVTTAAVDLVFLDDMEDCPGAWSTGGANDDWQCGAPAAGPEHAHSGSSLWATNLSGPYRNNANAWLRSPSISLAGIDHPVLSWSQWMDLENNWDFGYVEVSTDGANWTNLLTQTGVYRYWDRRALDLSAYAGATIELRFRYQTDGSVVREGWYVDDVRITGSPGPTGKPAPERTPKPAPELAAAPAAKPAPAAKTGPQPARRPPAPLSTEASAAVTTGGGILALPVAATVSIVETGRSVPTDPATGQYRMNHVAGDFTARAEAYGFFSVEQPVTITDGGTTRAHFRLEAMPRGQITGQLVDARTGEPVAGARVRVLEDPLVPATRSDDAGRFDLTVLMGTYTLQVNHMDYEPHAETVSVPGDEVVELLIALRPFIGIPDELAYDDGTAENAWAFFDADNAWAVRMTPDPARGGAAQLTHARVRFWDTSWPVPGGADFDVLVLAADGPDGAPGTVLGGPVRGSARRDGSWTEVDLTELGIVVSGDFYIANVQTAPFPETPGQAVDDSSPNQQRSWYRVGGVWELLPTMYGNVMIRARVNYPVPVPVITEPADDTYVAAAALTVHGEAISSAMVTVYSNGAPVGTAEAADGRFAVPIILEDGLNILTATATVPAGTTNPSAPVAVWLDRVAPELTVQSPADGAHLGQPWTDVAGQAGDDLALDRVTVNGSVAELAGDGSFNQRILLSEGENQITVVAYDRAGNSTTEVRTVHVNLGAPPIENLLPDTDVTLYPGDSLLIQFESTPGGQARYLLVLPTPASLGPNSIGTPMDEVDPGLYQAVWTPPEGQSFTDLGVLVRITDIYGNQSEALAPGRVSVVADPEAHIDGPNQALMAEWVDFDGSQSQSPNGEIVAYAWQMGDGMTKSGPVASHRYRQAGIYTVTLTITDAQGFSSTTTHQIEIRPRLR